MRAAPIAASQTGHGEAWHTRASGARCHGAAPAARPSRACRPPLTPTPASCDGATAPDDVLYIEDNPVNSTLMQAMLEVLPGVRLRCAATAAEGLAIAERERPRLILLDIQMPDLDGFEVMARLRSWPATRPIPVIAVTGQAAPQDLSRGQAAGFTAYLAKPLQLHALLQAVCDALGRPLPEALRPR